MNRYLSNIMIGLLQLVGSCLFLPLVKVYSRKQLFASSALTMAVSLSLLGLYLYSQTRYEQFFVAVSGSSWLAILCFSAYLLASPAGLCSVPLLYTAELFPTEMRGLLSGLNFFCQGYLGNIIGTQASPSPWPPPPPWSPR